MEDLVVIVTENLQNALRVKDALSIAFERSNLNFMAIKSGVGYAVIITDDVSTNVYLEVQDYAARYLMS